MVLNYVYNMFPTELAAKSNTQNIRTPKKHHKVQCSRDKKNSQYLQIMWNGKVRNQLLNSMLCTSEPQKHHKVQRSRDKKTANICKSCGRERRNGTKLCLCVLRNQLLNPILRTADPPKSTIKYSFPEIKRSCGRERPNGTKLCENTQKAP